MNSLTLNPADFVRGLFDSIDREIQTGVQEVQGWIDAQVHGAAVQLLHTLIPPSVHTNNTTVKVTEALVVGHGGMTIGLALGPAEVSNTVLGGAVANTVQRGLDELKGQSDYGRGVDSIAW